MRIKILKEVHSKKQKSTFCNSDDSDLNKICNDPMKEGQLEEMSAMGGGGGHVEGHAGGEQKEPPLGKKSTMKKFNKKQKEEQKLKGAKLAEMYSTSGHLTRYRITIVSSDKEHAGHVERSQHQGLRNVMEDDDSTQAMQGGSDNHAMAKRGTVWKLSDFADTSKNASRVFDVLRDAEENIGLDKMLQAMLSDGTSQSRVKVMASNFGYDEELYDRASQGDLEAVKKYYQFLINEFLFWSAYNPMGSAQQYSGRDRLLSKPTKDLAYAHVFRYVKNPSKNNPKSLGQRVANQGDFYKLTKDLDPALYQLPEE